MQVTREEFKKALVEMGHDPLEYSGKKLPIQGMSDLYGIEQDTIIEAIDKDLVSAHYDYQKDTIWIDALDAAHFFYCLKAKTDLYSKNM